MERKVTFALGRGSPLVPEWSGQFIARGTEE